MLNALVDGLGVRRAFLDSAEAVVRANEALDTCRPSRAARTDPGFRLPTAGDERREGMLATVAASSSVCIAGVVVLLGMRDGYPMDTGSWRDGVFGRAFGMVV